MPIFPPSMLNTKRNKFCHLIVHCLELIKKDFEWRNKDQNFEKESNWFWKREVINSTQQNLSSQGQRSCLMQYSSWSLNSPGLNCAGPLLRISFHKYSPTHGFASADSTNCRSTKNSIFASPTPVSQLQILNYGWKSLFSIWDWVTPPIKRVTVESKSHRGIFYWGGPNPCVV